MDAGSDVIRVGCCASGCWFAGAGCKDRLWLLFAVQLSECRGKIFGVGSACVTSGCFGCGFAEWGRMGASVDMAHANTHTGTNWRGTAFLMWEHTIEYVGSILISRHAVGCVFQIDMLGERH